MSTGNDFLFLVSEDRPQGRQLRGGGTHEVPEGLTTAVSGQGKDLAPQFSSAGFKQIADVEYVEKLFRVVGDDVAEAVLAVARSDQVDSVVLQVVTVDVITAIVVQQTTGHALARVHQELLTRLSEVLHPAFKQVTIVVAKTLHVELSPAWESLLETVEELAAANLSISLTCVVNRSSICRCCRLCISAEKPKGVGAASYHHHEQRSDLHGVIFGC